MEPRRTRNNTTSTKSKFIKNPQKRNENEKTFLNNIIEIQDQIESQVIEKEESKRRKPNISTSSQKKSIIMPIIDTEKINYFEIIMDNEKQKRIASHKYIDNEGQIKRPSLAKYIVEYFIDKTWKKIPIFFSFNEIYDSIPIILLNYLIDFSQLA